MFALLIWELSCVPQVFSLLSVDTFSGHLLFLWIGAQFPQEKFLSYGRILTLHYYFLLMCILFSCNLNFILFILFVFSFVIWFSNVTIFTLSNNLLLFNFGILLINFSLWILYLWTGNEIRSYRILKPKVSRFESFSDLCFYYWKENEVCWCWNSSLSSCLVPINIQTAFPLLAFTIAFSSKYYSWYLMNGKEKQRSRENTCWKCWNMR